MKFLRLLKKNGEAIPESLRKFYTNTIISKIRGDKNDSGMSVSIDDEAALFRKEIARLTKAIQDLKPDYMPSNEFYDHNEYVEQCKAEAKEELGI